MLKKLIGLLLICTALNAAELVDKIVAKVESEAILASELNMQLMRIKASGMNTENINQLDVLNKMIESRLIVQKAKNEGFSVDMNVVKEAAENQLKSIISQFPNEEAFRAELNKTGLTVLELKQHFMEQIEEQELKQQITNQEVKSKLNITEAEIEEYFEENKNNLPKRPAMDEIGVVVLTVEASEDTKEIAKNRIKEIVAKVQKGEDFAELAKQYSEGPSAKFGGSLGMVSKGLMVKSFEDAAFKLELDEVSEVVETIYGYHIIKCNEIKDNERKLSHILIKANPSDADFASAEKKLEELKKQVLAGKNFEEEAKKISSKFEDELIKEIPSDKYPEAFEKYLAGLDYGQVSQVFKEESTLSLFMKIKKVEPRVYKYEEVEDNLRLMVKSQKEAELYEQWIQDLMKESYIEILLED